MTTYVSGEEAAELTGESIATVDEAAATGVIPAQYQGWQLLVDPTEYIPPGLVGPEQPDNTLPPEKPEAEEVESWEDLTVAQLKQHLDALRIDYPSKARKADLIALLE